MRKKGHAKGLEEGEAKGEKNGKEQIARKMLAKGVDISTIAELTDLAPQEIEALKEPKASE